MIKQICKKRGHQLRWDLESPYLWSGYLTFVPTMWSRSSRNHNQQSFSCIPHITRRFLCGMIRAYLHNELYDILPSEVLVGKATLAEKTLKVFWPDTQHLLEVSTKVGMNLWHNVLFGKSFNLYLLGGLSIFVSQLFWYISTEILGNRSWLVWSLSSFIQVCLPLRCVFDQICGKSRRYLQVCALNLNN